MVLRASLTPMKFSRILSQLLAAACLAAAAGFSAGCATTATLARAPAPAVAPATGKVLTRAQLRDAIPGAIAGEDRYAEVNSAWLREWYQVFRAKLFKIGIVNWDERFDCNRFADFYSNLAQAFFSLEMFHSETPAQALALGPIWYVRADGTGSHAVIQALTERGRVFIDPQTGREMELNPLEQKSAYVQIF
jgi:hypothetical protein